MEINKKYQKISIKKKAAVFTILSILLATLLITTSITYNNYYLREKSFVIESRIKSVDYFVNDIEKDIKRGIYISTFRSLVGLQQHITNTGEYIYDINQTFYEIIINGTINGTYLSVMNNTELNVWIEKIRYESSKISIDFDYIINNLSVYHINPWTIEIKLDIILNITDSQKIAYWIRNNSLKVPLSIIDFEDPLYTISTNARMINTIKQSNNTNFVIGNNTTILKNHIENSYYIASNSSPSYLDRLSNKTIASDYGIESIVNLKELEFLGITTKEKSNIDYIYFSNNNPINYKINNTFEWFRIDNESNRLSIYGVEHLIIS
jgi:hypothetical protein